MIDRRAFIKSGSLAGIGYSVFNNLKRSPKSIDVVPDIEIYATNWGYNGSIDSFCKSASEANYKGIEVWTPRNEKDSRDLIESVTKYNLKLGLLVGNWGDSYNEHISNFKASIHTALTFKPSFINCHSGKDFFDKNQNDTFIDYTHNQSKTSGIPIYHETHRGRMLYNLPDTQYYLEKHKELELTLDISHWTCVHESLLEDQKEALELALNRTAHIHSRIGFQEAPQIPQFDDPKYKAAASAHFAWWDRVVDLKASKGEKLTMTTEFGPPPYMWTYPYKDQPLADVWDVNVKMKEFWENRYL